MKVKTVEEEWEFYRDSVYLDGVYARQNKECRNAFMAGALLAVTRVISLANLTDAEADAALEKFVRDTRDTALGIANGK